MKRGRLALVVLSLFALIVSLSSIMAVSVSINPTIGEIRNLIIYNISIDNTGGAYNITQVNITFYSMNVSSSSVNSDLIAPTSSGTTFTFTGNISNVSNQIKYFWFNDSESSLGNFKINITAINITSQTDYSQNKTITISDTTLPSASFVSPTPSSGSSQNYSYIYANVTASDSGSGLKNITIYLYNSTGSLMGSSQLFSYNFTNLNDDTYYINATVYDNANNLFSVPTITITIDTSQACTSNWTCDWSTCTNSTQSQVNCVDSNSCSGATAPTGTQACVSCINNWNCTTWTPTACASGSNQTRICTDLSGCAEPSTESRTCVITSASNANASGNSIFSSSFLFFAILGIIILSITGVAFALIRMKKKSASSNSGDDSGYKSYTPRGPPPPSSFPPPGYSNPPRVYQGNTSSY